MSGLVAGLVYERERVFAGTRAMAWRILRRARALCLTQMVLLVLVAAAVALHLRGADRWHLAGLRRVFGFAGRDMGDLD